MGIYEGAWSNIMREINHDMGVPSDTIINVLELATGFILPQHHTKIHSSAILYCVNAALQSQLRSNLLSELIKTSKDEEIKIKDKKLEEKDKEIALLNL